MNQEVSNTLATLSHPLISEIQLLRKIVLSVNEEIIENYKWNGPNYTFKNEDRITMRIHPPKKLQLIFHRGAKKLMMPTNKLIQTNSKLISWKENDRAVITFNSINDIRHNEIELIAIVKLWLEAEY